MKGYGKTEKTPETRRNPGPPEIISHDRNAAIRYCKLRVAIVASG
jgi:hypothetical protein